MRVLGIDPGQSGAVALVGDDEAWVDNLPLKPFFKKVVIDPQALSATIKTLAPDRVYIERVGSMGRDTGSGMFTFGRGFGTVEAVLDLLYMKPVYVSPQVWKRKMRASKDKWQTLAQAQELFPQLLHTLKFKKDNDKAEALLIAEYGRQQELLSS